MTKESNSKRIRIVLTAKLCADWSAVVEVPADASDAELAVLVDNFFHRVEMDEYTPNDEYWGKGECGVKENVDDSEWVAYRATRDPNGNFVCHKLTDQARSLWCVVHVPAFVPEMFDSRQAADVFKEQCDDYVSGPWEIASVLP